MLQVRTDVRVVPIAERSCSPLDAGNGLAEVILVDPRGRQDAVPVSVKQVGPGRFRCEYVPREPGFHSVNVFFAGRPIPNSPYGVNVASCMYPRGGLRKRHSPVRSSSFGREEVPCVWTRYSTERCSHRRRG